MSKINKDVKVLKDEVMNVLTNILHVENNCKTMASVLAEFADFQTGAVIQEKRQ